jgi:L-seryl-tRNA(Ser) seleniumtransferase
MPQDALSDPRRELPSVEAVLRSEEGVALVAAHSRGAVLGALRQALARRRRDRAGPAGLIDDVRAALRPSLGPVINATGVILNTNLGRAPLAREAIEAAVAAAGPCALEWDPATGGRGSRHDHLDLVLRELTGAEAACAVNTNAGAVLLALVALCSGREAIVSRGELVEIGGGFRVPEILGASGCRLVEVGTTNRTRLADYAAAVGPETGAILRVHRSNFAIVGFTESTTLPELVELATRSGVAVIDDLGSGALDDAAVYAGEPDARTSVAGGADLVCFSADKLLGGPQAGILVGRRDAIDAVRRHPLMRALRLDKLRVAALHATLELHRDQATALERIPVLRMLSRDGEARRRRAEDLATALGAQVVATTARVGGGALPLHELESFAAVLEDEGGADALAARLRAGSPAVAGRIADGRVLLDVAALSDEDLARLPGLAAAALDGG